MADRDEYAHDEILRLRTRMHKAESLLTAQAIDHEMLRDHEARLKALETFQNKLLGVMILGGLMVPPVTAWLVKLLG